MSHPGSVDIIDFILLTIYPVGALFIIEILYINQSIAHRAPYRYTGNTPVSTAGVALRGYPATVTFVTVSGNGMGPRIRWGVACTPTGTEPRVRANNSQNPSKPHTSPRPTAASAPAPQ